MEPLRGNEPLLPGYQLVGRLGSGGFGNVYAAEDSGGRRVAIKVLRPELSDDKELLSRLEREATALQQVVGDHTAKIHQVSTQGEHAFLVMDLIEGQNLEEYVRSKGPLRGFELRVVVEELVAALAEIHRAGVIHRDLKPSNVMYGPAGVTLLDFGISSLADSTALTKSGAFIGTAGWISPEQIEGRPVSTATDVFNLGLVIAYAATGMHPFGTGRPEGIMYRICHHAPEVSGVPEPIQGLVRECLNRNENGRVGIREIGRVIESDFSVSWASAEKRVEETVAGEIASTRRVGRRSLRPGPTIRVGTGTVPVEAVSGNKSPKKGVLALVSIVLVALIAAVIAIATTRSAPVDQQTASGAVEAPATTDESDSSESQPDETNGEIDAQGSSSEVPGVLLESVPPVAGVTVRPSSSGSAAPLAPTTTRPPSPGAIDGAPVGSGFRSESDERYSTFSEKFVILYSLSDRDGVSKSSIQVRRSNNQIVTRCRNAGLLVSGTRFQGNWRAECIIQDQQPSTAYSRTYTVEHCSIDNYGNEACSQLGTVFFSLTNTTMPSSSSSFPSSSPTSTSVTPTLPPSRESNPPAILSVSSSRSTYKRYETVTFTVEVADASGIENVTFRLQGFYSNSFDCWGSQYANFPKRQTFEFSCRVTPYAAGPYTAWVSASDYWNNFHGGIGVNTGYQIQVDFPMIRLPDLFGTQVASAEETLRAVGYEGVLSLSPGWCPPRGSGYGQGDIISMSHTQLAAVDVPLTLYYVSGGFDDEGNCP